MEAHSSHRAAAPLPVLHLTPNFAPVQAFSAALVIVTLIAAGIGTFDPGIFRDPAATAGSARGTDLVMLTVALPVLLLAMVQTARGSLRAQIVWLGALAYIMYNAVVFAFDTLFNPLFLVYVADLSLAVWALVMLLTHLDGETLSLHFSSRFPVRPFAAYLLVTVVLFAVAWLKDDIPAILNGSTPANLVSTRMPTNPFHVIDLGFYFPVQAVAAFWLWRRRAWGFVLVGGALVYGVIEAISVATEQVFAHLNDASSSLAAVPMFVALAAIALTVAVIYLRGIRHFAWS